MWSLQNGFVWNRPSFLPHTKSPNRFSADRFFIHSLLAKLKLQRRGLKEWYRLRKCDIFQKPPVYSVTPQVWRLVVQWSEVQSRVQIPVVIRGFYDEQLYLFTSYGCLYILLIWLIYVRLINVYPLSSIHNPSS
jgi:hypothetical protein